MLNTNDGKLYVNIRRNKIKYQSAEVSLLNVYLEQMKRFQIFPEKLIIYFIACDVKYKLGKVFIRY